MSQRKVAAIIRGHANRGESLVIFPSLSVLNILNIFVYFSEFGFPRSFSGPISQAVFNLWGSKFQSMCGWRSKSFGVNFSVLA